MGPNIPSFLPAELLSRFLDWQASLPAFAIFPSTDPFSEPRPDFSQVTAINLPAHVNDSLAFLQHIGLVLVSARTRTRTRTRSPPLLPLIEPAYAAHVSALAETAPSHALVVMLRWDPQAMRPARRVRAARTAVRQHHDTWFRRVWFCEERDGTSCLRGRRGRGGGLGRRRRGGGAVMGM